MTEPSDNKGAIANMVERAKAEAVRAAGEHALERAAAQMGLGPTPEEKRANNKSSLLPLVVGGVAVVFGGIVVVGLLFKLWRLALALAFFGTIGTIAYVLLAPRVRALRAQTLGKLEASRAEKQAADAARAQQRKLDAEFAALKKKVR